MKIKNIIIDGFAALAPMAGAADLSFRKICSEFGAAYTVSEMVSAKGISYKNTKSAALMTLGTKSKISAIQIFGYEPEVMAGAAEFAMRYNPQIIDINMGCPAPKICGNGSGAALMGTPFLCAQIVKAVVSAVDIPVTVKIRKGIDSNNINAVEIARICEANGAAAITVHGRTKAQFYSGTADLSIISEVKKAVQIPVIGNGDICTADDAKNMLDQTSCDLIMAGRGALGNPWLFSQINHFLKTGQHLPPPSLSERLQVMLAHIESLCEHKGETIGMKEARKHVAWYLKGFKHAALIRKKSGLLCSLQDLHLLCEQILS